MREIPNTSHPKLRDVLPDCLFLVSASAVSVVWFIDRLGFSSDDWAFFGNLSTSNDQSFVGLYRALYTQDPILRQRPVQIALLAGLFRLFGLNPLGYHLFNALVIAGGTLLFYLALRELNRPRLLAVTVPVVYLLLPNFSADRLWLAAFQAPLSLAFYFFSSYSEMRALRHSLAHFWLWKAFSLAALVVSGLAYELTLPLLALNALIAAKRLQALYRGTLSDRKLRKASSLCIASTAAAIAAIVAFKVLTSTRLGNDAHEYVAQIARVIVGSVRMNFGIYGVALPYVTAVILKHYFNATVVAWGGVLGVLVYAYVFRIARSPHGGWPSQREWITAVLIGFVVFGLGYVIMFTTGYIPFKSVGVDNRTAIAACVGVAACFVGFTGLIAGLVRGDVRAHAFAFIIAFICFSGYLVNNTTAAFWSEGYREQQRILATLRTKAPTFPSHSALILDEPCLKLGPAIVFASDWDITGAIKTLYGDATLRATVVTPALKVGDATISNYIAGNHHEFRYEDNIFLYNSQTGTFVRFESRNAADRYFRQFSPAHLKSCPGEFAWGYTSIWNE
jgi:hypothetical protein